MVSVPKFIQKAQISPAAGIIDGLFANYGIYRAAGQVRNIATSAVGGFRSFYGNGAAGSGGPGGNGGGPGGGGPGGNAPGNSPSLNVDGPRRNAAGAPARRGFRTAGGPANAGNGRGGARGRGNRNELDPTTGANFSGAPPAPTASAAAPPSRKASVAASAAGGVGTLAAFNQAMAEEGGFTPGAGLATTDASAAGSVMPLAGVGGRHGANSAAGIGGSNRTKGQGVEGPGKTLRMRGQDVQLSRDLSGQPLIAGTDGGSEMGDLAVGGQAGSADSAQAPRSKSYRLTQGHAALDRARGTELSEVLGGSSELEGQAGRQDIGNLGGRRLGGSEQARQVKARKPALVLASGGQPMSFAGSDDFSPDEIETSMSDGVGGDHLQGSAPNVSFGGSPVRRRGGGGSGSDNHRHQGGGNNFGQDFTPSRRRDSAGNTSGPSRPINRIAAQFQEPTEREGDFDFETVAEASDHQTQVQPPSVQAAGLTAGDRVSGTIRPRVTLANSGNLRNPAVAGTDRLQMPVSLTSGAMSPVNLNGLNAGKGIHLEHDVIAEPIVEGALSSPGHVDLPGGGLQSMPGHMHTNVHVNTGSASAASNHTVSHGRISLPGSSANPAAGPISVSFSGPSVGHAVEHVHETFLDVDPLPPASFVASRPDIPHLPGFGEAPAQIRRQVYARILDNHHAAQTFTTHDRLPAHSSGSHIHDGPIITTSLSGSSSGVSNEVVHNAYVDLEPLSVAQASTVPLNLHSLPIPNYYQQPVHLRNNVHFQWESQHSSPVSFTDYQRVSIPAAANNWTSGPTSVTVSGSLGTPGDAVRHSVVDVDTVSGTTNVPSPNVVLPTSFVNEAQRQAQTNVQYNLNPDRSSGGHTVEYVRTHVDVGSPDVTAAHVYYSGSLVDNSASGSVSHTVVHEVDPVSSWNPAVHNPSLNVPPPKKTS